MNVADTRFEAAAAACGAQIIAIDDERYPPLLREIHDPPPLLYVRGDPSLLREAQLAVVGSRRASPAGLRAAELLSGQLASAGLHICSGLALGIDGAAHLGALAAGGKSIAVMATGIDKVYPLRHRELAGELEQRGCLVTEFPPGTPPRRENFPQRNRIISGLSLGALVVEAALPSGSLITAGTALQQGREVFTLPWSIFHKGGEGCLHLIRDGAKMVQTIDDVLEELGPLYALQQDLFAPAQGNDGQIEGLPDGLQPLLELVGFELTTVDQLLQVSTRPVAQVLADLSALEMAGLIVRGAGGYIRS
jgi:DNA processing protein